MSRIKALKDSTLSWVHENQSLVATFGAAGAFTAALALGASGFALAQFEVCGQNMSGQLEEVISNLLMVIIGIAFAAAIVKSAIEEMKRAAGEGGNKFWTTDAFKAALTLPIALLVAEFALATIFGVDIGCLMPW